MRDRLLERFADLDGQREVDIRGVSLADPVTFLGFDMPDIIRVALVDDYTLFRSALTQLVDVQPDLEVVAGAGDACGALEVVRRHQPDVLVLDVDLLGPGAITTVKALRGERPALRILMLSMYDNPSTIRALLSLGVNGYLLKSCSAGELHADIRKVATEPGHVVLSVTARLFEVPEVDDRVRLSRREVQILSEAADALSNRQIRSPARRHGGDREASYSQHFHQVGSVLSDRRGQQGEGRRPCSGSRTTT